MPELFRSGYLRAASALTAVNGFKKTGIWPINRNVFTEAEFASAAPTNVAEFVETVSDTHIDQTSTLPSLKLSRC